MIKRLIAFALLLSFAAGCTFANDSRRKLYVKQTNDLTPEVETAVLEGSLLVGMRPNDVSASWGDPANVERNYENDLSLTRWEWGKRSVTAAGVSVTPDRWALFKDGKLSKWEDNRVKK